MGNLPWCASTDKSSKRSSVDAYDEICYKPITQGLGVVDYKGRKFCCAECAFITLNDEGIDDPIEHFWTFSELEKKSQSNPLTS